MERLRLRIVAGGDVLRPLNVQSEAGVRRFGLCPCLRISGTGTAAGVRWNTVRIVSGAHDAAGRRSFGSVEQVGSDGLLADNRNSRCVSILSRHAPLMAYLIDHQLTGLPVNQ